MTAPPSALVASDPEIAELVRAEEAYQRDTIRLIASENYVSRAVLEATGTVFANKYSEGYPKGRFYQGQVNCDALESLAIQRAKDLLGAEHANVRPYSGSPANLAVYLAFIKPGDTILGLNLSHGGHLTHGSKNEHQRQVQNARVLGVELAARGFQLISGGTDNHLLLIDLTNQGIPGKPAAEAMERAGLVLNYNTVPGEIRKPFDPSGIRLGTAAVTVGASAPPR